jgi:hypothetical protein
VLKNVMPKFPSDMADAPSFFAEFEKLFDSFSLPGELQSKLLMPYLNEKAKSFLLRLDKDKQDVYSEVKKFLLRELKLTPVQFKDRFDRAQRSSDETYTMFCSRLRNLLAYYCQSRSVGNSFDKLFSLCVADKIKSTLSEACLDHILTVEGSKWLQCDDLADTIYTYLANHTYAADLKRLVKRVRNFIRLMLTHREKRMPIIRGRVTRAVTALAAQTNRITLKAVKVTRKLVALLLKVKTVAKIKGCAISVNRRIDGSIIVLHVEVKRLAQARPKRR